MSKSEHRGEVALAVREAYVICQLHVGCIPFRISHTQLIVSEPELQIPVSMYARLNACGPVLVLFQEISCAKWGGAMEKGEDRSFGNSKAHEERSLKHGVLRKGGGEA